MARKKGIDSKSALEQIKIFYKGNDRLPSLGEIAKLFGFSSRSSAVYLTNNLISQGYMKKGMKGKLVTTSIFHNRIKLLGSVAAGFPTDEEEELRDVINLENFLVNNPEATYMLEVKGDSMINAGIVEGDMVLVDKSRTPKEGDIVIAMVDNEWTMKYYKKENGKVYLEPDNPNYPNIYPKAELSIGGVVISSMRKY